MITKEVFLDNTKDEEVFCVIHEALMRLNELLNEEGKEKFVVFDKDIELVAEQMIANIKGQVWL